METINERINHIVNEYFNANVAKFSRFLGVSHTTLNNIVANKMNKPSFDSLEKIFTKMPNINVNWLLTGVGNMIKSDEEVQNNSNTVSVNNNTKSNIEVNYDTQKNLIIEKERIVKELDTALKEKDIIIKDGSIALKWKDKMLKQKDDLLKEKDTDIRKLQEDLRKKDEQINTLNDRIFSLLNIR